MSKRNLKSFSFDEVIAEITNSDIESGVSSEDEYKPSHSESDSSDYDKGSSGRQKRVIVKRSNAIPLLAEVVRSLAPLPTIVKEVNDTIPYIHDSGINIVKENTESLSTKDNVQSLHAVIRSAVQVVEPMHLPFADFDVDELAEDDSQNVEDTLNLQEKEADSEGAIIPMRGRKRVKNEDDWKQNVRKRARNAGEEYITRRGKKVERRKISYHRCGRCVNNCNVTLPDEKRDILFRNYWQLGCRERQRDYISSHVLSKDTKRKKYSDSNRKQTLQYFFTVDNNPVKVCKAVFLTTLGIGEKTVTYTIQHRASTGQAKADQRGKHSPGIKLPNTLRECVRSHIDSFPSMESHYNRQKYKNSKRFLQKDLNIKQMYRLYCELYADEPQKLVKEKYYRDVIKADFPNLAFHKPKKDLCSFCVAFENKSDEEKASNKPEFEMHHQRKERVRELKAEHKVLAQTNPTVVAATFDLEQVLLCPKLNVSSLFYRRKLATYNLTAYNLGNHNVTCYMWHEGEAGRGSCEIATCMQRYFKMLPNEVKRVIVYSDTCSGQNRNQFFSTMCLNTVQTSSVETIDHIYMESGHSQMECDSVHSTIESALKNKEIYCPTDFYQAVSMARRKNPFKVEIISTKDIMDFKDLAKSHIKNRTRDSLGNIVQWLKLKWIRYQKETPDMILFKYNYDDNFSFLKVNQATRGRPQAPNNNLKHLYETPTALSKAKYDDLIYLCNSLAIPQAYHAFYKNLHYDGHVIDKLAEPDCDDIEEEDDDI